MNQPDPQLDRLLSALTEGPLDADQRAALNDLLRRDPARIEAYIDHLALHSLLRTELCAPQPIALTGIQGLGIRDQGSGPRDQNKTSPMASPRAVGVALAATILLAVTVWFALPDFSNPQSEIRNPQSFASVATLTNTTNAAFADTAAPMRLGGSLPAGPIHLTSGKAQIMFASTAVVDLTGPCEFEMTGPNRGRLTSGTLEAFVPENAQGFTVDLPDGSKIVDLGTAFRVKVDELGQSSVRVHSGTVLWTTDGPDGESVRISAGRIARMVEVAPKLTDPAAADVPVRTRIVTEAFATRVSNDDLATPVSVSLPDGWTLDTSIPHSHEAGILFDGIDANPGNGRVVWRRNDGAELSTSDYIAITGQLKQPWIVTDIRVAHDWGGGSKAELTDVQVALSNGAETLGTFSRGGLNDDVIEDIDEVATQRSVAPVTSFEFRITGGESQSLEVREIVIIGRPLGPEFEPEESGLKSDTCPEGEYE